MRESFKTHRPQAKTLALVERANTIVQEYLAQGFELTLRQLFYQTVARGILENCLRGYKRLGEVVRNARRSGLLDWDAIEDRTRFVREHPAWTDPASLVAAGAQQYRENPWKWRAFYPEAWIEKDALIGVIEGVCDRYRVPYFACRGNVSDSEMYAAANRFSSKVEEGKTPVVFYLGDHDPNGLDMTRDIRDRLAMFARQPIEVRRLALNMDQIERYRLSPNFAKEADPRFAAYVKKYGRECWELDALAPDVIAGLIEDELRNLIDVDAWNATIEGEEERRALLKRVSMSWTSVEGFIRGAQ
jgi:hypothetical protein